MGSDGDAAKKQEFIEQCSLQMFDNLKSVSDLGALKSVLHSNLSEYTSKLIY